MTCVGMPAACGDLQPARPAGLLEITSTISAVELTGRDLLEQILERRAAAGDEHDQSQLANPLDGLHSRRSRTTRT